jgi:hypothetical protein
VKLGELRGYTARVFAKKRSLDHQEGGFGVGFVSVNASRGEAGDKKSLEALHFADFALAEVYPSVEGSFIEERLGEDGSSEVLDVRSTVGDSGGVGSEGEVYVREIFGVVVGVLVDGAYGIFGFHETLAVFEVVGLFGGSDKKLHDGIFSTRMCNSALFQSSLSNNVIEFFVHLTKKERHRLPLIFFLGMQLLAGLVRGVFTGSLTANRNHLASQLLTGPNTRSFVLPSAPMY